MTDVETVARAMRVERIAYRNRISKEEALVIADDGRYTDAELLAATAALAAATPLIEARVRNALVEIAGLTHRQQLPITAQIHEVALAALGKGERP